MSGMPPETGTRTLRVLVVAHNAVGASNRRRLEMLAEAPGLEVALLSPRTWFEEGRQIDIAAPQTARFLWRTGRTLATNNTTRYVYLHGLFELVRGFRPDVLDVHEEPFSFSALQALLARDWLAPRAALVFYSAVNVHRRWRMPYRAIEKLLLARADGAYAPNAEVPEILRAKGLRSEAATIPLGVDVERFATGPRLPLDDRLGGAQRPYVGFLGRLEPVKGIDGLLEAAARMRQSGTIVIAGEGSERARLAASVRDRGLSDRVRFLPVIPFDEVPSFMRALDVLVLPSVTILPLHKEQFGRVLAEAMAAGVPVVGSSSGAIPEVIGDAGLVVPERDPAALAAALDRLACDAALRADLAARGRRRASEQFGWPVVVQRTVAVYETALARRRGIAASARGPAEVRV